MSQQKEKSILDYIKDGDGMISADDFLKPIPKQVFIDLFTKELNRQKEYDLFYQRGGAFDKQWKAEFVNHN